MLHHESIEHTQEGTSKSTSGHSTSEDAKLILGYSRKDVAIETSNRISQQCLSDNEACKQKNTLSLSIVERDTLGEENLHQVLEAGPGRYGRETRLGQYSKLVCKFLGLCGGVTVRLRALSKTFAFQESITLILLEVSSRVTTNSSLARVSSSCFSGTSNDILFSYTLCTKVIFSLTTLRLAPFPTAFTVTKDVENDIMITFQNRAVRDSNASDSFCLELFVEAAFKRGAHTRTALVKDEKLRLVEENTGHG
mmetsp:Transcript_20988/g.41156  ORF Transcript_20988/g.41156 Transcript_20988/m.41156 type:complete len:252 (+) Transcript_20988:1295-2050(+)